MFLFSFFLAASFHAGECFLFIFPYTVGVICVRRKFLPPGLFLFSLHGCGLGFRRGRVGCRIFSSYRLCPACLHLRSACGRIHLFSRQAGGKESQGTGCLSFSFVHLFLFCWLLLPCRSGCTTCCLHECSWSFFLGREIDYASFAPKCILRIIIFCIVQHGSLVPLYPEKTSIPIV